MRKIFILLILLTLSGSMLRAEESVPIVADSSSLHNAGDKFDPVQATQTYLNSLSGEKKEQSDSYYEGGYWLILWGIIVEFILLLIYLYSGLSSLMKRISARVRKLTLQHLIYIVFYIILSFLITLPYSIYTDFIREKQYGLMNLGFGGWLWEEIIGLAISLATLTPLILLIYFMIRRTGNKWWIWATGISTAFVILFMFIYPVFIAPLFNHYGELPDNGLKREILSLARANSIPTDHVYQFDASKQTDRVSANVSGIGKTIRISLNDNLLNRCSPEEIKAVMAHEMGHYVLNHVRKLILTFSLLLLLGFGITHWAYTYACRRWGSKWKISGIEDIGGLPLLVFLLSFVMFLFTPLTNNIIRSTETEADIFGLNAAREPDGFAGAIMLTTEYRKADPGKWEEILFYDHPSPKSRVVMAMKWKAENQEN